MFRLPFGRKGGAADGDPVHGGGGGDEVWPDMEAMEYTEIRPEGREAPSFHYEEGAVQPAGVFTAELVGWSPVDAQRTLWKFRIVPEDDVHYWKPGILPFVTSTVCRPDNHLYQLVVALNVVEGIRSREDLSDPDTRTQLRDRCEALVPMDLIGRRCRIEVEHLRDDLGDTEARIKSVAPLGWM